MDVGIVAASFLPTYFAARRFGVPGPGSWAVLCTLAVASWRLYRVGARWHDLGLRCDVDPRGLVTKFAGIYVHDGPCPAAIVTLLP
jgi:hypothetical protein